MKFGLENNAYIEGFKLERTDWDLFYKNNTRVDLNGYWRLRKLNFTNGNPKWDITRKRWIQDGSENPVDDVGTRDGFWKPDYDDSNWVKQFVPWDWNTTFNSDSLKLKPPSRYSLGGVGWYRKRFTLPKYFSGKRIILHFDMVEEKATVWVMEKDWENIGLNSFILVACYIEATTMEHLSWT